MTSGVLDGTFLPAFVFLSKYLRYQIKKKKNHVTAYSVAEKTQINFFEHFPYCIMCDGKKHQAIRESTSFWQVLSSGNMSSTSLLFCT